MTNRYATWPDTLGLDSQYDYDPVWAKCVELNVTPTFHTASQGVGTRVRPIPTLSTTISDTLQQLVKRYANRCS